MVAKRWGLLKAMCGAGPMSIREVARRVDRDVKAVHGDVTALLYAGVRNRTAEGESSFRSSLARCPRRRPAVVARFIRS